MSRPRAALALVVPLLVVAATGCHDSKSTSSASDPAKAVQTLTSKAGTDQFSELRYYSAAGDWYGNYRKNNQLQTVGTNPTAEIATPDQKLYEKPGPISDLDAASVPAAVDAAKCSQPATVLTRRLITGAVVRTVSCGQQAGPSISYLDGKQLPVADAMTVPGLTTLLAETKRTVGEQLVMFSVTPNGLAGSGASAMSYGPKTTWAGSTCYPNGSISLGDKPSLGVTCDADAPSNYVAGQAFPVSSVDPAKLLSASQKVATSVNKSLKDVNLIMLTRDSRGLIIELNWTSVGGKATIDGKIIS